MVARHEDESPAVEPQLSGKCGKEQLAFLELRGLARLGDVARHGHQIDAGALGEATPCRFEILEEGLPQPGEVLTFEAAVGTEVEVGEMQEEHAVPVFDRVFPVC